MKPVEIVVTANIVGNSMVIPYSHEQGLQRDPSAGAGADRFVIYQVPAYEVLITGGGKYKAIRFALRNRGEARPPATRGCDAGLAADRWCKPSWVTGYSPHSFDGVARAGAWRLLPGRGFLIHEGANAGAGTVGGSIGCVEILDGRWNAFLGEIERLGKGGCAALGNAGKVTVHLEAAHYPNATLVKGL